MRVALRGRNLDGLRDMLRGLPLQIAEDEPDVVISYGGDGSLLGAEREFPGVTKCPIRDQQTRPKCPQHGEEHILQRLVAGDLPSSRLAKITASKQGGEEVVGLNDILINKQNISSAVRCRLWLDGELYENQIVGDGVVMATPFGSTGYFRSITRSLFRVGIGLAFNNCTEPLDHLVIDSTSTIRVEIIRGPAVLLADNDPARVPLTGGDVVTVRGAETATRILGLDGFRCQECYRLRQLAV